MPALTEESKQAQNIKDRPLLVITGNPPYSGHSKNNGDWITNKIKDYYFVDGKPLKERNPKWLQDDYVKFIRFAQDKMEKVEEGIVGVITNHRFLTNPTFRGMRQSLMQTFNQIYFIDLHGSNKPKEFTPAGDKDENVFDIEQGVAISLFVKKSGLERKIFHSDFWGTRNDKYKFCLEEELKKINWQEINATSPFYTFKPEDKRLKEKYYKFPSLNDIFIKSSLGIFTHRDHFLIDTNQNTLNERINEFRRSENHHDLRQKFNLSDTRDWKVEDALKSIKKNSIKIETYQHRPFDNRFVCYNLEMYDRGCSRYDLMKSFLNESRIMGLISGRAGQNVTPHLDWNLAFVTSTLSDANLFSRGGATVFPLYIVDANSSIVNLKSEFIDYLGLHPLELLGYIYSILYSPSYRKQYADFLRIDFPRIPFAKNDKVLEKLVISGYDLIKVHLLRSKEYFNDDIGHYIGKNHVVEKPEYRVVEKIGRLFINKVSYFDNVPREVYEFYIGGYQVLDKYLKDRKGQSILHESEHVEEIIKALAFTIEQMKKIDALTKNWI